MKFGQLTVLGEINENKRWKYKVQCDCGKVEVKRKDWVISGRTTSCKSCASKRTAAKYPPPRNFKGIGGLSKTHFSYIKHCAHIRNIPFNISMEFLWELFQTQQGLCALTNIPIALIPAIKACNVNWDVITASVDRKDSLKGYTEDNVWWVHKEVNRLKNNYSLEELLYWSKLLLDKHGNPDPSVENAKLVSTKEQRLGSEEATNNLPKSAQHPYEYYSNIYTLVDDDIV